MTVLILVVYGRSVGHVASNGCIEAGQTRALGYMNDVEMNEWYAPDGWPRAKRSDSEGGVHGGTVLVHTEKSSHE